MAKKDETVLLFGIKLEKWKDCPICGKKLACEFSTMWHGYAPRCPKCLDKKSRLDQKNNPPKPTSFGFSHFKEVTGFGYEKKTGRYVGITAQGKHIDPSDTRYDVRKDPHGWKAVGKQ